MNLGPVQHFDEIDSTNRVALESREDGAVFVADRQSAGRGRVGRTWDSGAPLGLWVSVCLSGNPRDYTMAAALAVRDACAPHASLDLKWPNDLVHEGRKVCGILVEHRSGWSALGIGLNLNHTEAEFPEEFRAQATSLRMITGEQFDRDAMLSALCDALGPRLANARGNKADAQFQEWGDACGMIGQRIQRAGVTGEVHAYQRDGALLVNTESGSQVCITDAET